MTQPDPAGPMPTVLAALAELLSGQLTAVANDLRVGTLTAWQCLGVAGKLSEVQRHVAYVRRDVSRLSGTEETS